MGPSFPFPHVVTGPQWLHPLPCPTKRLALRSVSHTSRGGNHTKSLALGGLGADLCSAHHGGALWGGVGDEAGGGLDSLSQYNLRDVVPQGL